MNYQVIIVIYFKIKFDENKYVSILPKIIKDLKIYIFVTYKNATKSKILKNIGAVDPVSI